MRKPSPALFVACLALFISLGGGAYATTQFRITSIHQIARHVRRELRGRRGLVGPQGQQGAPGAAGVDGAQGPAGPAGPPASIAGGTVAQATLGLTRGDGQQFAEVRCNEGSYAFTGGYSETGVSIDFNAPLGAGGAPSQVPATGWQAAGVARGSDPNITVWAYCLPIPNWPN